MNNYDIAIIGGCASGLAAAINAGRTHPNCSIAVIEALPKAGKKILATGNGRCNLTNIYAGSHNYSNKDFADYALKKYNVDKTLDFFSSLGLKTYTDAEGRVYPYSNTAASVLDSLRFGLEKTDVICNTKVSSITKTNSGFCINNSIIAKRVIISAGGKASPSQGSDGSGYNLAKMLGHTVTDLYPSLVPLNADSKLTKPLKGVRIHNATLKIIAGNKIITESSGELLFTETGLSGIVAMETASHLEESIKRVKQKHFAEIDFAPDYNCEEVKKYLKSLCISSSLRPYDSLLTGIVPKVASLAICKVCSLDKGEKVISKLTNEQIDSLVKVIKHFRIELVSTKGFNFAQVTHGGVKTDEINPKTMESLITPGLYFSGEIIDVDGGCGGFNLQWAWSSGLLAGELGGN